MCMQCVSAGEHTLEICYYRRASYMCMYVSAVALAARSRFHGGQGDT